MTNNDCTLNINLSFDGRTRIEIQSRNYCEVYKLTLQENGEIHLKAHFPYDYDEGTITKFYEELRVGGYFRVNYLTRGGVIKYLESSDPVRDIRIFQV